MAVVGDPLLTERVVDALWMAGHTVSTALKTAETVIICRSGLPENLADDVHIIHASRVGADLIDDRSHLQAAQTERLVADFDHTIVRTTHLHEEVWEMMGRIAQWPLVVVPHDTRFQPVDTDQVARQLAAAVELGPVGQIHDVGGRFAYDAKELARSHLAAIGRRRPIVAVNRPGLAGAAMRAGANLTPNRDQLGITWNEFVAGQVS